METQEDAMLRRINNAKRMVENCERGTRAHRHWQDVYSKLIRTVNRGQHKRYYNPIRLRQGSMKIKERPIDLVKKILKWSLELTFFVIAGAGIVALIILLSEI